MSEQIHSRYRYVTAIECTDCDMLITNERVHDYWHQAKDERQAADAEAAGEKAEGPELEYPQGATAPHTSRDRTSDVYDGVAVPRPYSPGKLRTDGEWPR